VTPKTQPLAAVYDTGGMISYTRILLRPDAVLKLIDDLRSAIASPESIALASWPRDVCTFPVSPHTRGYEQYLSIHVDSGPQPYTKWQLRARELIRTLQFIFMLVGVVASVRWLLHGLGA
jgi:hypothetical protein